MVIDVESRLTAALGRPPAPDARLAVAGSGGPDSLALLLLAAEAFPGHIACSSESKSEIVVPVLAPDGRVIAVLDVDSDQLADFSAAVDQAPLEEVAALLAHYGVPR